MVLIYMKSLICLDNKKRSLNSTFKGPYCIPYSILDTKGITSVCILDYSTKPAHLGSLKKGFHALGVATAGNYMCNHHSKVYFLLLFVEVPVLVKAKLNYCIYYR